MLTWTAFLKMLCLCCILVGGLAFDSHAQKEGFLLYISGGPAFSGTEKLEAGWTAGGGLGIVLSSHNVHSMELGIRMDFYRFNKDTYLRELYPQYTVGHENHGSADFTLKYRRKLRRFFNPYGVFGIGFYEMNPTALLGVGSDLGTGPEDKNLVFWELRYIPHPYKVIRLHVGVRLG